MHEPARLYAVAAQVEHKDAEPTLLMPHEQAYVSETATGLTFAADTPIEIWGGLVSRLTRQHKRIEWAIGDALQFGEHRYGDTYAQWADETGLSENTLATIKWVAGAIQPSRRREGIGWSHHREVAALDPTMQDRLLEKAADEGLTRFALRQAVKVEQERQAGHAVTADGADVETPDLPWCPGLDDLTPDARRAVTANAPLGRHRNAWISGYISALVWAHVEDAFVEWRGP